MLPRFRSFYGKIITFALVALVFIVYIKVLQIDEDSSLSASFEKAALKQNPFSHIDSDNYDTDSNEHINENEIPRPVASLQKPNSLDYNSVFELSIQRDLAKQEPGLGDMGEAAYLEGAAKKRGEEIYKKIALNEELSEHLSYNRTLDDFRHPLCAKQHYDVDSLPTTSVIIIFYNEPYSVLLRTVHSTLNTCVGRLLKQIILVDDGSTNEELGDKLDYYIRTRIPNGKVSVVRLKNRYVL